MTLRHPANLSANISGAVISAAVYLAVVLHACKATISDPSPVMLAVDCALAAIPAAVVLSSALRTGR